ncbi:MAG: DUF3108 domain-containing protein [Lentisphaerae bacterium]|nr:MAG: DUF3108 domain-containing protein [Lentisphaerota bacterium]
MLPFLQAGMPLNHVAVLAGILLLCSLNQGTGDEIFKYEIVWNSIRMGSAEVQVSRCDLKLGDRKYRNVPHLVLKAETAGIGRTIYAYDIIAHSYLTPDLKFTLRYQTNGGVQDKRRKKVMTFDWKKRCVNYIKNNNEDYGWRPLKLSDDAASCVDPLGIFLFLRHQSFDRVGQKRCITVSDGKTEGTGCLVFEALRQCEWQGRAKKCQVFLADLGKIDGLFKTPGSYLVRIWFSADQERLPLKFEGTCVLGTFTASLISYSMTK